MMKRGLLHSLGLVAAALLALGAGSAAAQVTTANGPYYATPSWDQTLPVSTRFIVLSNMNSEAVLDRETGLVWEKSPQTFAGIGTATGTAMIGGGSVTAVTITGHRCRRLHNFSS